MNKYEIEASIRTKTGRGASRRLRVAEKVPAILYGGGKEATALEIAHNKIAKSLGDESFYSRILTLKTGTESEKVILKDVQRHPYKPRIIHLDLQRVRADEKLHMNVPLHFIGGEKAPGVKEGGMISHIMSDAEVSCFPDKLPEFLSIDISEMKLNDLLHLSDIKLPEGVELVELMHGNDRPVVSLHMQRIEEPEEIPTEAPTAAEVPATAQKSEAELAKEKEGKEGGKGK